MQNQTEPVAYSIAAAVEASNGAISRAGLYRAIKNGEIEMRKKGRRSFLLADEFKRWLSSMPIANVKVAA